LNVASPVEGIGADEEGDGENKALDLDHDRNHALVILWMMKNWRKPKDLPEEEMENMRT